MSSIRESIQQIKMAASKMPAIPEFPDCKAYNKNSLKIPKKTTGNSAGRLPARKKGTALADPHLAQ